jgi:hypothetical protein
VFTAPADTVPEHMHPFPLDIFPAEPPVEPLGVCPIDLNDYETETAAEEAVAVEAVAVDVDAMDALVDALLEDDDATEVEVEAAVEAAADVEADAEAEKGEPAAEHAVTLESLRKELFDVAFQQGLLDAHSTAQIKELSGKLGLAESNAEGLAKEVAALKKAATASAKKAAKAAAALRAVRAETSGLQSLQSLQSGMAAGQARVDKLEASRRADDLRKANELLSAAASAAY